jgi:transcriptional regulator with XRE-family HTH domain
MNYEDYAEKRRRSPGYIKVEKRLKPVLDLADDVLELRMERGWTQAELAERVGTKQANISRLENGLANPTLRFLEKLGEVFKTELVVRLRRRPVEVYTQPVKVYTTILYVSQPAPTHYLDDQEYVGLFAIPANGVSAHQQAADRTARK